MPETSAATSALAWPNRRARAAIMGSTPFAPGSRSRCALSRERSDRAVASSTAAMRPARRGRDRDAGRVPSEFQSLRLRPRRAPRRPRREPARVRIRSSSRASPRGGGGSGAAPGEKRHGVPNAYAGRLSSRSGRAVHALVPSEASSWSTGPRPGTSAAGSTSRQGTRTKARSWARGWGRVELRVVGDDALVGDDVDVDGAGPPALVPYAFERLLDGVAALQERARAAASS